MIGLPYLFKVLCIDIYIVQMNKHFVDDISLRLRGDHLSVHDPLHPVEANFKLYTMDISYFSGKIEKYLWCKGISFERLEPHSSEHESILAKNTGSEQLPQLYDCRNATLESKRWMRDTTPIIEYLENDNEISKHSLPMLPSCEVQKFFHFLIEDYCDEFLWRVAMFWRWCPSFDREIMGKRFYYEFTRTQQSRYKLVPWFTRPYLATTRQWLLSVYGEGITTVEKENIVMDQYYELLEILNEILKTQPYLFGNHPTLVDIGFMGPMYKHFSSDPSPRKVMQLMAPKVYTWVAKIGDSANIELKNIPSDFPKEKTLPENWNKLLELLPDYLHYYRLNTIAYMEKKKKFDWKYKGEIFTVPTVPYRVWCREELQKKYRKCSLESQSIIKEILTKYNCFDMFIEEFNADI